MKRKAQISKGFFIWHLDFYHFIYWWLTPVSDRHVFLRF